MKAGQLKGLRGQRLPNTSIDKALLAMAGGEDGEPGDDYEDGDYDDGNLIAVDRGGITVTMSTI